MESPPPSVKSVYSSNCAFTKKYEKSRVRFYNSDCIDLALSILDLNPLVLNLSDDLAAGGCVASGSGAQEESLFRRTNYFQSLLQSFYPIEPNEVVYSPNITVFKTSERTNFELMPINERQKLSFVALPGLNCPNTDTKNNEKRLLDEDVQILKMKIKLIIKIAVDNNHETIILGALGGGVWMTPRRHLAEIFKEVLEECDGVVLNYYFAIMTTTDDNMVKKGSANTPTFDIFVDAFQPCEETDNYFEAIR